MRDGHRPWPFIPHCSRDQAGSFLMSRVTHSENQDSEMMWLTRPHLTPFPRGVSCGGFSAGSWVAFLWLNHITHPTSPAPPNTHTSDTQHLQRLNCVSGSPPPEIQRRV